MSSICVPLHRETNGLFDAAPVRAHETGIGDLQRWTRTNHRYQRADRRAGERTDRRRRNRCVRPGTAAARSSALECTECLHYWPHLRADARITGIEAGEFCARISGTTSPASRWKIWSISISVTEVARLSSSLGEQSCARARMRAARSMFASIRHRRTPTSAASQIVERFDLAAAPGSSRLRRHPSCAPLRLRERCA